jgi:F0F1-type ATP synthase epsilon subunit
MRLQIVTPEGKIFENHKVEAITATTVDGVLTIKNDHIPLLSLLIPGGLEVTLDDEGTIKTLDIAVSKGVLEIRRDSVVNIMADTAEAARKRAEEILQKQDYSDAIEFTKLQAKIEKELARINIARKYRNVGGGVKSD